MLQQAINNNPSIDPDRIRWAAATASTFQIDNIYTPGVAGARTVGIQQISVPSEAFGVAVSAAQQNPTPDVAWATTDPELLHEPEPDIDSSDDPVEAMHKRMYYLPGELTDTERSAANDLFYFPARLIAVRQCVGGIRYYRPQDEELRSLTDFLDADPDSTGGTAPIDDTISPSHVIICGPDTRPLMVDYKRVGLRFCMGTLALADAGIIHEENPDAVHLLTGPEAVAIARIVPNYKIWMDPILYK